MPPKESHSSWPRLLPTPAAPATPLTRLLSRRRQGIAAVDVRDDEDEDELFAPFKRQLQEQASC